MRVVAIVVVAAFAMGAASGANAEPVKKRAAYEQPSPGSTTIISRDEQGRTRTKILVQKRSYLDGGTEVMPGDIQGHRTNFIDNSRTSTGMTLVPNDSVVPSHPVNDPFFLPGKDNPYFR